MYNDCKKCGGAKKEFYTSVKGWCKECENKRNKEYKANKKEKELASRKTLPDIKQITAELYDEIYKELSEKLAQEAINKEALLRVELEEQMANELKARTPAWIEEQRKEA